MYINLARKYRPNDLSKIIGQKTLVKTIKTAFELNKVSSVFLFTGTRGVGKTSVARIIAKMINCYNLQENTTPCGKCKSCIAIQENNHMDIIEFDAASQTSIEDIKAIMEDILYQPVISSYKVFIIDEVHMLSKSAFNALLKTLEEPPENVKFIFATTEINKIPITILSRCQKFDLKHVSVEDLKIFLKDIIIKEKIQFDEESIHLMAVYARGSVRDALSLLDQAIIYCDSKLQSSLIYELFGLGNKITIYDLFLNLVKQNKANSIKISQDLLFSGVNSNYIVAELLEITHNVNVYIILKNFSTLYLSDAEEQKIKEISNHINLQGIMNIWQILTASAEDIQYINNSNNYFMLLISKLLLATNLLDVEKLLQDYKEDKPDIITSINELIPDAKFIKSEKIQS